ncbi:hypothetical protein [Rhizobium rhizogenes]|uniref:hypothetical protein n=1 Tax=Rhizobium rhizogenes TaxID=359 RepID=UPI0022C53427|nr:hypothetical protein [Rhizobium rhizogenes]MCZ7488159.1 hypothetical protein [Rhizobium rhizogenes]
MTLFDFLKVGLGVLAGIALASIYDAWIDDPAVEREARAGYVLLSEKTSLQAQINEIERQKNAASQSLEEYRKHSAATLKLKEEANARLEKFIAEDRGSDGCTWGDDDLEWLRKH